MHMNVSTRYAILGFLLACIHSSMPGQAQLPKGLDLSCGDRVAFVGNTFFEREQREGHLETAFTLAHPDHKLTFRNLGWSGDTVNGQARAFFGPPADGYKHLLRSLDESKPTVILANYGFNAAFEGKPGLDVFLVGYRKLIGDLQSKAQRVVLVTPVTPFGEHLPKASADTTLENLALYTKAIRSLADELKLSVLDLASINLPLASSENGIHLTPAGYHTLAKTLFPDLNLDLKRTAELRTAIKQKNALFFHQYRPQNETYLRGFRKHEQGQNAREIPQFDPLIAKAEATIHRLAATLK